MSETKKENPQEMTQLTDDAVEIASGGLGPVTFIRHCRVCGSVMETTDKAERVCIR